jgi:hypothetical protein
MSCRLGYLKSFPRVMLELCVVAYQIFRPDLAMGKSLPCPRLFATGFTQNGAWLKSGPFSKSTRGLSTEFEPRGCVIMRPARATQLCSHGIKKPK